MANRIQLRRGNAQEWANTNPTLAQGELGIELDTGRFKIGDGVSAWNTLRYERPVESVSNTPSTLVQRDSDGNFSAGTITSTLIGNASTASRLASPRQIQLDGDVQGSAIFDGSSNLTITTNTALVATLPHYDGTLASSGTYTKVTVDAKGLVTNASNPTTLAEYGLDGGVTGSSAQPYDPDLAAFAGLTSSGILTRVSGGNITTRTIIGTATRISVTNGNAVSANPAIDLITTAVTAGDYNTESLTSVSAVGSNSEPFGTETVNATKFTVDDYGRLTSATNVPIATATEGSKYASYDAGTTYSRYDIIEEGGNVYQSLATISAGGGAPSHTSGDTGQWRYLAAAATEQKGLASFAQEDFDVDNNGHVTIAAAGVDNTQLQNNRISFADGNTKEDFELDQELTSASGYRGFNYLNYVKVNDTSGNLLFGANNTGDSGAGEIDVNVRSYFSDPDITLDGAVGQTLDKTGDGNLTFQLTQNSADARNLSILSTNAGAGTSTVTITAEDVVDIDASDANGKVHVENARFQANYIATTDATMNLDPGDDRAVTGLVRVWGDLQVDGTTTTVNSTTMTVDDVVLTLGGDTAPVSDDNLDRGVEFRYYDTEARLGFYGWDTNYTDLGGHEGGYRFLHAATNTSETFAGTDSGIIAGNVKLTTGTNSTSNTTGDLVVAGGVGITQDVNIGGLLDVDGTLRVTSTSRFDDSIVLQGASKTLQLNNGSGTTRIELQSTTGNADFYGIVNITNDLNINTNKFNVASATGNTLIAGTLGVTGQTTLTGALDLNNTLNVSGHSYLENTDEPSVSLNETSGLYEIQSNNYGAFRLDGGGYIEGDMLLNSDVYVNGTIIQKEDVTANFSRQNYLEVRYKLRSGTRAAYTPSYATHDTSNLRVYGGAGIATTLHVGGTGSNEGLFVGKEFSGSTVKFSVLGASGNTDIQGTLDVAGNSEFNGTVDVDADFAVRNGTTDKFFVDNVTGNTDIQGTLDVNGATEITNTLDVSNAVTFDQTLLVQGNSEFNGTVDIDADFAVRSGSTDKFTIASATGNASTEGTLNVESAATFQDNVTINADNKTFAIQNNSNVNKFTVDTDNGNTDIQGTLNVEGAITLDDTLYVSGNTNIDGTLDVDADFAVRTGTTDKFTVASATGNTVIEGTLNGKGAVDFDSTLNVDGNTTLVGTLTVTNTSEFNNTVDVDADFAVRTSAGADKFTVASASGNVATDGTLVVQGQTTINDSLIVDAANEIFSIRNGSAVEKFGVDADNGNTNIIGTLTVGDATQINDTLGASGIVTLTNNTDQTLTGNYGADGALRLTGGAAVQRNLAVGGNMRVYGDFEISGSTTQSGNTGFSGRVTVTNTSDITSYTDNTVALSTEGGFRAEKNAYIGGDLHIWDDANSRDAFYVDTSTGDATLHNTLTVGGNLVVNGTTTTVNSTVTTLDDPIITLGGDTAPASNDGKDRGVEFRYYDGSAKVGFFGFDRSANQFAFLISATNSSEVLAGTDGALRAGSLNLTGSGTSLDVDANANIDGTLTVDGQIISQVTSGPALVIPTTNKINNLNADLLDGLNTSSTDTVGDSVVTRSSGNFSANQITVNNGIGASAGIQGNATTADALRTARVITIDGVVNGNVSFDGSQAVTITTTYDDADITALAAMAGTGFVSRTAANTYAQRTLQVTQSSGITLTNADGVSGNPTINVASTSNNSANNLVLRDASGGFSAEDVNVVTLDATGNSTIGGTLGVTGVSTLTGLLNANGGIAVDTNNFTVNGTTGAVSTASTLNADGATTLGSTLAVTGATTLSSTLGVTGNVTASADLDVTSNATVGGTLGVTGATTLSSTLAVTGTSTFTGAITASGGVVGNVTGQTSDISNHDTDALSEGSTNLYFTNERVDDRIDALFVASTGITKVYDDTAGTYTLSVTQADINTDNVTEGSTNLFTTAARTRTHFTYGTGIEHDGSGTLSVTQADIDTDNVTEGSTNLFTTAARTRTHFTYGTGIELSGTGELSVTQADINTDNITEGSTNIFFTDARAEASFDTKIAAADTDALSEGSTNLYYTEARAEASFDTKIAAADTDDLSEGTTNLYYTTTRANTDFDTKLAAASTTDLSEGTNLYFTDARADARVAAATGTNLDLTNQSTTDLSEGTNLYYTEARVQDKLDNAFAQLQAMLNNLATTTTLTLNLSGDPTPGAVVTAGSMTTTGLGGFTAATGVTTTGGTGTGLTVDTTVVGGEVTAVAVNAGGSDYLITDTITLTNPNLGGVATFNFGALVAGTQYTTGTGLATTGGDGSNLTVDITASGGSVTNVTVNNAGSGYGIGNTITIVHPNETGIETVDTIGAADASRAEGTYDVTAFTTTGSGTSSEFQIVVDGTGAATVTVTEPGTGHSVADTITISDTDLGGGGAADLTFNVATIYTSDATIDLSTVFTDATFTLSDITTMEVGATVTGATSGTTGVITALGTNQITVDNVGGFFKVGEVVSANDVTTLTVNSFS